MKRLMIAVCLCAAVVMAGCAQQAPQETAKAAPDFDAIAKLLEKQQYEYADAWSNLNMDKIGEVWSHDADVTIWGADERDRVEGWDTPNGVKAWYQAAMDGMKSCDFKMHDLKIKVSRDGTAAVITYYVENDFVLKDGTAGKGTPRVTVVKEIQDGKWKQIHGDASFSVATIKGM